MITSIPLLDVSKSISGKRLVTADAREFMVSVVCVTRNASLTLPALLKSIRNQKTIDFELIIVDGASTDGTIDILRDNGDVIDFWISGPDHGIYDAMNNALNYVKGKWILFLGADDLLLDGFGQIFSHLKDHHTVYYGNLLFYGKPFNKVYDDYYLTKLNFCQQAVFYPVSVFEKYSFDLQYKVYADYLLNLKCWRDPQFNFRHVNHTISWFSDGGFSSYEKDHLFEQQRDRIFKQYLKPGSYYRYLNRTLGFPRMLLRFLQNK
jgi:glycosyltransferase involved in cell wall biosynthesis